MKRKTCYICGKPITSEDSVSYGFKTGEICHLRCKLKSDGFDNSFLINGSLDFKNMPEEETLTPEVPEVPEVEVPTETEEPKE